MTTAFFFLFAFARTAFPATGPKTFTDSHGDIYTVRLAGPGSAVVTLDDPDLDTKGPIAGITLTGTDSTTRRTTASAYGTAGLLSRVTDPLGHVDHTAGR